MLGVSTGGRISELLSLRISDVYQNHAPVTDLLYDKSIVKGGEISRAVPINADGRHAIGDLVAWHREQYRNTEDNRPLFPSRHKSGTVPLHRQTAHQMLKKAFIAAGLNGKIATHSLRKSFAQRVYEQSNDIYLVKELLGHKNVSTTQQYLGVNYADAREAVESIALDSESYIRGKTYNSLKKINDNTLIRELQDRGYDITSPRNREETTAEIQKIAI